MRLAGLTGAALLIAASGYAQDEPARRAATEVAARVPLEQAAKGVPYAAETLVEGTQQLADGNRIVRKTTGRVYRDGEGRTRREEDRPTGAVTISITDPVAGFSYSLDAQNKIAWRTPIGVGGAIMNKMEAAQTPVRRVFEERVNADGQREAGFRSVPMTDEEKQKVEAAARAARIAGAGDVPSKAAGVEQEKVAAAGGGGRGGGFGGAVALPRSAMPTRIPVTAGPLEHKTIEGVAVEGRKTTTVIPAGQVGNEQPITITSEQWRSPDLNVLVMTRHSDPRTGDSSYRLLNIIRAEPDRSLFMVPPDYTVKDTGIRKMLEPSAQGPSRTEHLALWRSAQSRGKLSGSLWCSARLTSCSIPSAG